jgi:hypothetical protein
MEELRKIRRLQVRGAMIIVLPVALCTSISTK